MSSGLLAGIGRGIAQTGQMMGKDALEAQREKRLEEARIRQEKRESAEYALRQDDAFRRAHGADADPNAGTENLNAERQFRSQYGAEANFDMGAQHYSDEAAIERARRQKKNELGLMQVGDPEHDPNFGYHQRGADNRILQINPQSGGISPEGATGPGGITEPQMQAIYRLERDNIREGINPTGDFASNAMIQRHGGWQGWSNRYADIMSSNPGYLEWRELVFGIPNPDTRDAPAAQELPPVEPAPVEEPPTELETGRSMIGRAADAVKGIFGSGSSQADNRMVDGAQGTPTNPYRVNSQQDVEQLPSGAVFVGRDGVPRIKP